MQQRMTMHLLYTSTVYITVVSALLLRLIKQLAKLPVGSFYFPNGSGVNWEKYQNQLIQNKVDQLEHCTSWMSGNIQGQQDTKDAY